MLIEFPDLTDKHSLSTGISLFSFQCFTVLFIDILQAGEAGDFGVIKKLKRYKTSSTKTCKCRQPHPSLQAVQQPAILDAVLETTARLTLAATVMQGATTSTTAVMTLCPLAATVSVLNSDAA